MMNGDCEADESLETSEKAVYETLAGRCLALIFKEKRHRKRNKSSHFKKQKDQSVQLNETDNTVENADEKYPKLIGKEFFEELQKANARCFWNPHLEESMRGVNFAGWLEPCSLLVTGRDIYLETLKSAWAKKILRPPAGYHIFSVGEVFGLDMQVVAQTQFTPLPDALCVIISELNTDNTPATLPSIESKLKRLYHGIQPPAEEIVFEMLDTLIQQRKIFYTGNGYQIMTPALMSMPGIPAHMYDDKFLQQMKDSGLPAFYFPTVTNSNSANSKKEMTSSYCQTSGSLEMLDSSGAGDSILDHSGCNKGHPSPTEKLPAEINLATSQSTRTPKSNPEPFERSSSLRHFDRASTCKTVQTSPENERPAPKDINLKTSQVHQDKNKGEKASLFSKLFGRNKKKPDDSPPSKESTTYVTFSAQFPPPEWTWYESEYGSPTKPQVSKSTSNPQNDIYGPASVGNTGCENVKHRRRSDDTRNKDNMKKGHQRRKSSDRRLNHRHSAYVKSSEDKTPSSHRLSYPSGTHAHNHEAIYERIECKPNASDKTNCNTDIGYRLAHSRNEQNGPENQCETNDLQSGSQNDSMQETFIDQDISIRYEGRVPKKDLIYTMSCESGVNCVGIDADSYVPMKRNQNATGTDLNAGQLVTHVAEVHMHPMNATDKKHQKSVHNQQGKRNPAALHVQDDQVQPSSAEARTASGEEHLTQYPFDTNNLISAVASSAECSVSCSSKSSTSRATVIELGVEKTKASKSLKPAMYKSDANSKARRKPRGMPKPQNYVVEDGIRMKQVYAHRRSEIICDSVDTKKKKNPKEV